MYTHLLLVTAVGQVDDGREPIEGEPAEEPDVLLRRRVAGAQRARLRELKVEGDEM